MKRTALVLFVLAGLLWAQFSGAQLLLRGAGTGSSGAQGTWTQVYTQALTTNSPDWSACNLRQVFNATTNTIITTAGSALRLTIQSSTIQDAIVGSSYWGKANTSVNAWNFDGTQVPVTVGGTAAFTIPIAGVVTDPIVYPIISQVGTAYIWSLFFNGGATHDDLRAGGTNIDQHNYFKCASTDESGTTTVTGYTNNGQTLYTVTKVEVLVP